MEDHTNTCRLAVTAAFARGMPNFRVTPGRAAEEGEVTVYHAMPHGLCGPLGDPIVPTHVVNTAAVHAIKREALAAHASQKAWLDRSQGMDSYLVSMDEMSREVAAFAPGIALAEGWRRHLHLGFCGADTDPLRDVLGKDCRMRQASPAKRQRKSS
jgi:LmbE family N-acetylglucosaminyl deacetylase